MKTLPARISVAAAIFAVVVLSALVSPVQAASRKTEYSVLMMEQPAGTETATSLPGGQWTIEFEFNDRGRGPKLTSRLRLDESGIPTGVGISGVNYLKVPVDEKFGISAGRARWKSASESGEKPADPKAFYLSLNGAPQEIGFLARALLRARGEKLALLPDGEASIRKGRELAVEAGGRKRTVVEYFISGLDFTPTPVWLDGDREFFALASGWMTVIQKGWEKAVPDLLKAQDADAAAETAAREKTLAHRPAGILAVTHAELFDSETALVRHDWTVLVAGEHIQAAGPSNDVPVPPGAEVVDARGKTLLPGLWDMHVHLGGDADGVLHLASGVTSVRDLANDSDRLLALRRKFDTGESVGPRILMAGLLDGRGPYTGPTKVFADSEEEARKAIDNYAKLGYVQIKIYSSVKPELVPAIARMAHAKGLRVSGHVPAFMTAEQFVRDGADEIQHVNFLFLNFLFDTVKDTRTPARFTEVAEHAASFDFSSEKFRSFLSLLKTHDIVCDPTVAVFEDMFLGRPTSVAASLEPVAARLPAQVRRSLLNSGLPMAAGKEKLYADSFRALLRMVGELYRAGVTVVAGTDGMPGFTLDRELELYVEAGIPAPKVLQLATLGAATVMGRNGELGWVHAGKLADFILVDGDPTSHIGDIRRVMMVVKNGVRFDPAELDRSVGVTPLP
ncbi:MAG: amidohydrolase family protein [Thermoanaerobaculia bacterium]